jgi:hypothetical protein
MEFCEHTRLLPHLTRSVGFGPVGARLHTARTEKEW